MQWDLGGLTCVVLYDVVNIDSTMIGFAASHLWYVLRMFVGIADRLWVRSGHAIRITLSKSIASFFAG